jgi:hypothetical protein
MKRLLLIVFLGLLINNAMAQRQEAKLITTDITNFWNAYDQIIATKDTTLQLQHLNQLFIDKGTPGLKAMMKARSYTPKEYVEAINKKPEEWNAIRANTLKADEYAKQINANIKKFNALYPELRPSEIYFTVGAYRSGGTTQGNMILIGSEIAFRPEPLKNLVFTVIHEYVHTQEKTNDADNLLAQCVMEGVAEFVAEKVTGLPSTMPAKKYGYEHFERIREVFEKQLFNTQLGFWMYSDAPNEFNTRDLGYDVGYTMCEKYYAKAADKKRAIKEMIEVDIDNPEALARFVDASGYFTKPVAELKKEYEANRPVIVNIKPFNTGDSNVNPSVKQITLEFSQPMNKIRRNFELGPLGKDNLLKLTKFIGFSEDGSSFTFETELSPGRQYQIVFGDGFKNIDGAGLKPYLLDFKTAAN